MNQMSDVVFWVLCKMSLISLEAASASRGDFFTAMNDL